jgi:uncharacterized membrane protein
MTLTTIPWPSGLVLLGLASVASLPACSGSTKNQPPPATAQAAQEPADDVAMALMEHHRYHHHGGVTLFIAMSLDTIAVAPEKSATIAPIRAELVASMNPGRVAEQALLTTLADGLAAGTIDTAKVDAGVADVTTAARSVHDRTEDALNQLHAALSPAERAALADKVVAHWAVWKRVNGDETGAAPREGGHLATLASELDLTADQVNQIEAAMARDTKAVPPLDPKEIDAELRAFGEAFRRDTFDAKALIAADEANAHMVGWAAAHLAHFVEAVGPVLAPDQRTALADKLRAHAAHDPSAEATP